MSVFFTTGYSFATANGLSQARHLPDRLADTKNVKDWGAVGDGVTDDYASIQAALNAIWGGQDVRRGRIYFPPGTYLVSQPIAYNPPGGGEHSVFFIGAGNKSKITGSFDGGIIQRFYRPPNAPTNPGPGPASGPVMIENLWINQDGELDDVIDAGGVQNSSGSFGIYISNQNCVMIRNCRITTKKHGIGQINNQGWSIHNCDIVCTGATANRWGIVSSANGTTSSCYVKGFTSGVRVSQFGGCTRNCIIENNTVGWEGGPYNSRDPAAPSQFITNFAILGNTFRNNGTGITGTSVANGAIVANDIIGGANADVGYKSGAENPNHVALMGNTFEGAFATAAVTTASNNSNANRTIAAFIGVSATNSGAGVAWGESQANNLYNNVYINANYTGPASRKVFAGLPTVGQNNLRVGDKYSITDCNTNVWAAAAAGGGSNHCVVVWNGAQWSVAGK